MLYRTVGANYYENVMHPRILENTKAVFSRYTAENLIARRNSLSDSIKEDTAEDLQRYGITIARRHRRQCRGGESRHRRQCGA